MCFCSNYYSLGEHKDLFEKYLKLFLCFIYLCECFAFCFLPNHTGGLFKIKSAFLKVQWFLKTESRCIMTHLACKIVFKTLNKIKLIHMKPQYSLLKLNFCFHVYVFTSVYAHPAGVVLSASRPQSHPHQRDFSGPLWLILITQWVNYPINIHFQSRGVLKGHYPGPECVPRSYASTCGPRPAWS